MTPERAKEIMAAWAAHESIEPDISTERLMAMTADTCGCDIDDVVEALAIENDE